VDTDFTWFHSQVSIEEITSNKSDIHQHVADTYASVIRTSLYREENKVPWINKIESGETSIFVKIISDWIQNQQKLSRNNDTKNIFI